MDFSNLRGALVVSGIAFVTACGGGGGGAAGGASGSGIDGGATTVAIVPITPDVVTVDGVVAKGPAKGAKAAKTEGPGPGGPANIKESLPARYNDRTELTLAVQPGKNEKNWELTK